MSAPLSSPSQSTPSALPVVALIVSTVSLCLGCFWPVAVVLSIVALVKTPAMVPRHGLALASVIIAGVGFIFLGIQAAVAIPNFIRFQTRAKQSECKANLRVLASAAQRYHADEHVYTGDPALLYFNPEAGRYAYLMDPALPVHSETANTADLIRRFRELGIDTGVNGGVWTAACLADLDSDPALDVWTVSSQVREGPNGTTVPAFELKHDVDDSEAK
ncbi:MAG: type IV pilin protein [Myxococcaceae bacterium]